MRNDDDIRTQQRKLEGVAAPLGEGSENSQLLQKLLYEGYTGTKHTTRRTISSLCNNGSIKVSISYYHHSRSRITKQMANSVGKYFILVTSLGIAVSFYDLYYYR